MPTTYQFGNNPQIDYPRLLIADTDMTHPIFDDREILMMYNIERPAFFGGSATSGRSFGIQPSYRRVAAALLDCLAANKARLAAALEVLDIKISGADAAKALKDQAAAFRGTDDESANFAMIERVYDAATYRERVWNTWMRELT